jgi:colicin import membrane protein
MSTILNARYEFAPPPTPGLLRALALAIAAHGLLLAFLAMGVQWKHLPTPVTVEAELWSSVPQSAAEPAPNVTLPPPTPPEPPTPVVAPTAPPKLTPPVAVEPSPDPAIAIAKEKARLKNEKLAKLEQEKREKEAHDKELREKEQRDKLAKEKLERERLVRKKPKDDAASKQAAKDAAKEAAKDAAEEKKLAELRQENMKRLTGLAAGTGEPGARGTAAQSSGPSAGYAGKIRARIRPNITYIESITGNPAAEVEVRAASGGTILSRKLVQSSGIKSWDDAVLNAIDKTETLPADTDGKVPSVLILVFRPKD